MAAIYLVTMSHPDVGQNTMTLFGLEFGQTEPFAVDIHPDRTDDALKTTIIAKKPIRLQATDPDMPKLWDPG